MNARRHRSRGNAERCPRSEQGLLSTELALLMPIMFVFALLGIFVIQVERLDGQVQQAADVAARAASLERTEAAARSAAVNAAGLVCAGTVQVTNFMYQPPNADVFIPGSVRLDVSCTENFRAFGALTRNTVRTESATAIAVIEYWTTP